MAVQNRGGEQSDPETVPLSRWFLLQMVLLSVVSFAVQIGFWTVVPLTAWSMMGSGPSTTSGPRIKTGATVLSGNSVIWKGEIWISATTGTSAIPGIVQQRGPSSTLYAINPKTGQSRDTRIVLSPSPLGLLVVDDQLWAVSETTVFRIQNNQLIQRNPGRGLIHPTKPFIYDGRLAIIDQNENDVSTLLTWADGEWVQMGYVDGLPPASSTPWFKPELRVVSDGKTIHLFFWDGQSIRDREGIDLTTDLPPVSALSPENFPFDSILNDRSTSGSGLQQQRARVLSNVQTLRGWQITPVNSGWNNAWEVGYINGELWIFSVSSTVGEIQRFRFRDRTWIQTTPPVKANTTSLSLAGGSTGYLVTDQLQLRPIVESGIVQSQMATWDLTNETMPLIFFVIVASSQYFIAAAVLVVGSSWLMKTHRTSQYEYGKRSVIQASILRRAIARVIDSVITIYPTLFWLLEVTGKFNQSFWRNRATDTEFLVMILIFSIFGVWIGSILVLSYFEGCWGFTPGKWLCGIRTFRTTLRPCGMLRAFAREMLVYVDSLFLVTWIPGVMTIAFTKRWQRIGDLVAETIVVIDPKQPSWIRRSTTYQNE